MASCFACLSQSTCLTEPSTSSCARRRYVVAAWRSAASNADSMLHPACFVSFASSSSRASYDAESGEFLFEEGSSGKSVDTKELANEILEAVESGDYQARITAYHPGRPERKPGRKYPFGMRGIKWNDRRGGRGVFLQRRYRT